MDSDAEGVPSEFFDYFKVSMRLFRLLSSKSLIRLYFSPSVAIIKYL